MVRALAKDGTMRGGARAGSGRKSKSLAEKLDNGNPGGRTLKVVGKTSSKRLARDPAPAEVVQIRKEDIPKFQKLAKQYGILYFFVHKKGNEHGMTNIVSNQNYAAQLNAAMEELGYPVPRQAQENTPKKAIPRTQPERSFKERGSGSSQRAGTANERSSVKGRLETLRAASERMKDGSVPVREKTR